MTQATEKVNASKVSKTDRPFFSPKEQLSSLFFQPKLSIGPVDDVYEREADAMADKIMRMTDKEELQPPFFRPRVSSLQRKCVHCEEEANIIQRKELNREDIPQNIGLDSYVNQLNSGGQPLTNETRNFYEPRFGYDFSKVKVHTDSVAAKSAQSINALAYTSGTNIVFNKNQFNENSENGKKLLAHELMHVVQQNASIDRKMIQRAENDTSVGCSALADTKTDVNAYVNSALASLRPAPAPTLITGIRNGIGNDMLTSPGRTQVEGWAAGLPATKAYQPPAPSTKYSGATYRLWSNPLFPILNPTMKVNGVCIGSDKLGHFFQQGHEYYQESHRSGGSLGTAIAGGQAQEAGGYGLRTTGVYSNADLEANRKGLDFYNDLALTPAMSFDIASYINPNWSEVNNPNFYESSIGQVVWRNLLTGSWNGFFEDNAALTTRQITASLTVDPSNNISITGTFSHSAGTGTLSGIITHNAIPAPGGAGGMTAISGVTINYNWVSGLNSGKGTWNNRGENELFGTWGNGISNSNGGNWGLRK